MPSIPTWFRPAASAATAPRRRPSPSNAPWTTSRRLLGIDPFAIRRKNKVRATDRIESIWKEVSDVVFGSYGLDQCLDLVETGAGERTAACRSPTGTTGLEGTGIALAMLESGPPTEHRSGAEMRLLADGTLPPRRRLDRDGQRLGHLAPPDRRRGSRLRARAISPSSTATPIGRPTTPAPSPAPAQSLPGRPSRRPRRRCATCSSTSRAASSAASASECRLEDDAVICANRRIPLAELHAAGTKAGDRFEVERKAYLSPRSVGFNVHGVRLAVHRVTGEITDPAERARRRHRPADQSDAVPRPDRRRHRHGLRLGALPRRWCYDANGADGKPGAAQLPHPGLRRRAAQRDLFRRHLRHGRAARRQGAGRMRHQPGRAGDRQRASRTRPACASRICRFTPDRIFDRLGAADQDFAIRRSSR